LCTSSRLPLDASGNSMCHDLLVQHRRAGFATGGGVTHTMRKLETSWNGLKNGRALFSCCIIRRACCCCLAPCGETPMEAAATIAAYTKHLNWNTRDTVLLHDRPRRKQVTSSQVSRFLFSGWKGVDSSGLLCCSGIRRLVYTAVYYNMMCTRRVRIPLNLRSTATPVAECMHRKSGDCRLVVCTVNATPVTAACRSISTAK